MTLFCPSERTPGTRPAQTRRPFDDIEQRARGDAGQTPLDAAASRVGLWGEDGDSLERFGAVADLLVKRGAEMTVRAAVALGNMEWLRAARRGHTDEPD